MRELSLFTGAGGGILGSKILGWTTIGYVEIDDYRQQIIAQRIADGIIDAGPIYGDIKAFLSEGYAASYQGMVDVITAGFPCQPFSVAGKGLAENDPRNLWPETIETIRIVRPKYILLENVRGLLSKAYFKRILGELAEIFPYIRAGCLSACTVGAPHQRTRLWIVADSQQRRWCARCATGGREEGEIADGLCGEKSDENVADAESTGEWPGLCESKQNKERRGRPCNCGGQGDASNSSWWEIEPRLGRVAHGVAHRVDRLEATGLGQVPAVVAAAWRILSETS